MTIVTCIVERSASGWIFLIHTCSSLDQSHSCGCVTIGAWIMERCLPEFIFLVHVRSSLDQSNGRMGITNLTCIKDKEGVVKVGRVWEKVGEGVGEGGRGVGEGWDNVDEGGRR